MQRGFASYLFILGIATILALNTAFPHAPPSSHPIEMRRMATHRLLLENGIDSIIVETLREGLVLKEEPETIRTRIHQKILDFISIYPTQTNEPISFTMGFVALEGTNYFSIFDEDAPPLPLTLSHLNTNAHVLVLPLEENARYGEYTYTGGSGGNEIPVITITAPPHSTLWTLPSGYHVCVFSLTGEVPCAP